MFITESEHLWLYRCVQSSSKPAVLTDFKITTHGRPALILSGCSNFVRLILMNIRSQDKVKDYYCKPTLNPTSHFHETAHMTLLVQTTCFDHFNSLQRPPCYTIY